MKPKTITIRKWSDVLKLDVAYPMDYFRGQSNADWPLTSSLLRATHKHHDDDLDIVNTEYWMLREFKRGASLHLKDIPDNSDYIGWLSLMQHHGAPTRLIDFTRSFYVACYFALLDANGDCAVWAIDPFLLFHVMEKVFGIEMKGLRDEWDNASSQSANSYLSQKLCSADAACDLTPTQGVLAVEPFQRHVRLATQQGLFLMPLDVQLDLLENLNPYMSKSNVGIKKIILKHTVRDEAMAHLKMMNITSASLFPGIDGFARSLIHRQFY